MDVMEQQTEALDLHTNALQILLGETRVVPIIRLYFIKQEVQSKD